MWGVMLRVNTMLHAHRWVLLMPGLLVACLACKWDEQSVVCWVVKWSCFPEWPLLTAGPTLAQKCHAAVHAITGASPYAWCCKLDIQQSVLLTWQVKGRAAVVRVSNYCTCIYVACFGFIWCKCVTLCHIIADHFSFPDFWIRLNDFDIKIVLWFLWVDVVVHGENSSLKH